MDQNVIHITKQISEIFTEQNIVTRRNTFFFTNIEPNELNGLDIYVKTCSAKLKEV